MLPRVMQFKYAYYKALYRKVLKLQLTFVLHFVLSRWTADAKRRQRHIALLPPIKPSFTPEVLLVTLFRTTPTLVRLKLVEVDGL